MLAAKAEYEIAQSYIAHGRYNEAIARLSSLIANEAYAKSDYLAEARKLLGQSYLAQQKFEQAILGWKNFLEHHPAHPSWSEVQRWVIDAEYAQAEAARADENYELARELWETFLNKYPLDGRAAQILFRFGQMKFAQAVELRREDDEPAGAPEDDDNEVVAAPKPDDKLNPNVQKLFEQAIEDWRRLVSKYPGTNEASQAAYMIGVTLEDQLGRLADALEAYKKVEGQYAGRAQKRIANLTSEQLELFTERKFRSDEQPVVKLRTRNLEQVTVKVYRIDMADYFRKMHLAGGVETLDIALIDPDNQLQHNIAGYEKYKSLVNEVAIPLEGPGVTAVTVVGEKLEATTMVVVSDIDVIVKASRNELFVFAQNMRTGKPAPGVSLLVSDGSEVFAEELTGDNGVFQKSYDKLKTIEDLRLFAVQEGHMASTVTSLAGLDFAVGLSPRGYLYTDRPAYRPGQLVNLKGIVRWVSGDEYTFKEGEEFTLDIYDSRGRTLRTQKVQLGAFGTFHDHLTLPESAAQGQYRAHLHKPDGSQSYETAFTVHEIQLEPVELSVKLDEQVVFRGEKISGTIRLAYYYGTPLPGRTIQYRLADDRLHTATTNEKGEVTFELETRRFSESQALPLVVEYPERGLTTEETVYVATRGFDVAVSTLRDVYISGETFDATISVTDPAGEPVATELKLEVFRLYSPFERDRRAKKAHALQPVGLAGSEALIATHTVKTDKDGTARHTLRLDESGRYRLRATGTDRFGNPVSGAHVVYISGEDDAIRLRILAEKHHYEVGDTAKVQLHWREKPALALVAYEGAQVLGYRLVELKEGANPLEIPLEAKLAPNFRLAVDVMQRNHFHQAASLFTVERKLNIELKPSKTTLAPGEELTVDVTVTDAQGKPVSAELSLGLVQKNLLEFFGEHQWPIAEFFSAGERQPSLRAATSATFSYRPHTRGISEFLLAEAERQQILERETAAWKALYANRLATEGAAIEGVESAAVPLDTDAREFVRRQMELLENFPMENNRFLAGGLRPGAALDDVAKMELDGLRRKLAVTEGEEAARLWDRRFDYGIPMGLPGNVSDPSSQPAHAFDAPGPGLVAGGQRGWGFRGGMEQQAAQNGAPQAPGDSLQLFAKPQRDGEANGHPSDHFFSDSDGSGLLDKYDMTLSMIVRQTQSLDAKSRQMLGELSKVDGTVLAVNQRGEVQVVNGLAVPALERLAKSGLRLLPNQAAGETGYWNPLVVTGKDGKAQLTFRLPERSTAWKLRTKGIDSRALAGEAEVEIFTRKDLFGEMKTPLAFYQGDKPQLLVEVHNATIEKGGKIDVVLKTTIGERSTELKHTIEAAGPGVEELSLPVEITAGDAVSFELTVTSGDQKDVARAEVPVRPFGYPVFGTSSGSAAQSTIVFVDFPGANGDKNRPAVENPALEIVIGPSVNRTLLDAVLGGNLTICGSFFVVPDSGFERSISDVLGGVALLATIRDSNAAETPEAEALAGRIRSALSTLISSQRDDGGWTWSGRPEAQKPDRFTTSRTVWALAAARRSGFAVPQETLDKAVGYLKTAFSAANRADREGQAILLHALAEAGEADVALANRLYRERNDMSVSGLLHLGLALARLDRQEMARDLLQLVQDGAQVAGAAKPEAGLAKVASLPWMSSDAERKALHLLLIEEVAPGDAHAPKLADELMSARRGSRWQPEKANGPAVAALARWFARVKHVDEKYTLAVYVNDKLVERLQIDPGADASRRLEVPAELLAKDKPQRINFDMEGRGRFSYSAVLSGFTPAEKLASTTKEWAVSRTYQPAPLLFDGQPVPRGFHVLTGSYSEFRNPLTELPLGERGEVTLSISRYTPSSTRDEELDYLVVTEPIPAGNVVLTESIQGGFERYEIGPGAITFYIGDVRYPGSIQYTLVGYLPGDYRALPTLVRSFYRPERAAVAMTGSGRAAKPDTKSLAVLPRGEKSKDEYRLTPVELFELGKRHFAKREYAKADEHLTPLFENWRLRDEVYQESALMLFRTSLELARDGGIVRYFEIIKEKYPEVEIDFDSILKVAASYRELGEYERSYLVFRATIEAAFQRESQIAGFLDARGEFLRSVQVMERLLVDYPAEPYIATATYSLAGEVYGKAPEAASHAKLKEAGITRVDLIAAAVDMLDHFLSTWPKDPAADQAAFSLATALIDLERYDDAIARATEFADRYPESKLLDSFWYVIGYSHFALSRHEAALEMARKVAEFTRKDPGTGLEQPADNKWQAVYIMGQVYHSLGKPAEAIEEYERVDERFPDAAQAIDYFTRKAISLPEVTTVKPGEPAKVELDYRNLPQANVKVYRIDLMKFGLMQRNLERITAINLAGIRPYHELSVELGDGKDYRDREKELSLPLKEEGAYLVVARGENQYASGLVLVTPLDLDIQEDPVSGRVRVTVKNTVNERFANDVHVKVIGSAGGEFVSGETDLRGLFIADAIEGTTTVIARADDARYAFYRGKTHLGTPVPEAKPAEGKQAAEEPAAQPPSGGKDMLLDNIRGSNSAIQQEQRMQYRNLLENESQGVKAKAAF
ncbi:MAG: outer membrane protein assembly factor BamD [Planctomycetes bacterium]|nr:outer membrane protein assembly factor BamD [Planctomycetota bacterium]